MAEMKGEQQILKLLLKLENESLRDQLTFLLALVYKPIKPTRARLWIS